MKKKEDLRIVKTRASLYRGLLELLKTNTFESIKISDICSVSLINRSTFYDHFNDKNELLAGLISDMRKDLERTISVDIQYDDINEYFMIVIKLLLDYIEKHKSIYSTILKINNNSTLKDMFIDVLSKCICNEVNKNYINESSIPTKTIIMFYVNGSISIIFDKLSATRFEKNKIYDVLSELIKINLFEKK